MMAKEEYAESASADANMEEDSDLGQVSDELMEGYVQCTNFQNNLIQFDLWGKPWWWDIEMYVSHSNE